MEQTAPSLEVVAHERVVLPYPPSWVDHFTAWVERQPGPAWLYYLAAMALYFLAYLSVKWWESGFLFVFPQIILLTSISALCYLGAIHYLDKVARNAMTRFRPVIEAPASRVAELDYRLTTMPARVVWFMTLLGALGATLIVGAIMSGLLVYPDLRTFTSLPAVVLEVLLVFLVWIFFSVRAYHTAHQMHTVSLIYTELTKIDLFNQGPLHAFARLAAYTAITWVVPQYFWFTAGLKAAALGVAVGFLGVATVLGVITFIWLLYGIHRLLALKKEQLQSDSSQRLERSLHLFAQALDKDDLAGIEASGAAMRNAEHERQIIAAIPTWPWPPSLLRGTATAFFLPLIIWVATRILERFLGS